VARVVQDTRVVQELHKGWQLATKFNHHSQMTTKFNRNHQTRP
jgi:hypothetical protein